MKAPILQFLKSGFELGLLELKCGENPTETAIRPIGRAGYELTQHNYQGSLHELYSTPSKSAL